MEKLNYKPVVRKILADTVTPVSIYLRLRTLYPKAILLESSDYHGNENAYSFICFGPVASFTVSATGTAPLGYQWRKDGVALVDGVNISGSTAPTVYIVRAQIADAGNYSVLATNAGGTVTSANALLTVSQPAPPKFDVISVLPDSRVRFVLSGEPGTYVIESATDLSDWSTFTNLTIVTAPVEFVDDSSTNTPRRFYRAKADF